MSAGEKRFTATRRNNDKKIIRFRVKEGVYKDKGGNVYLKVPNSDRDDDPYESKYSFLKEAHVDYDYVPLKKIVDVDTIKRKHESGMYFIDKNYAYIHIDTWIPPGQRRLTAVKAKKAKTFGLVTQYLKTKNTYYFNGIPIFNLDVATAKYIVLPLPKHNTRIELVRDKSGYFLGRHKLTVDLLCRTNYTNLERTEIIQDILGNKKWSAGDCKQF